MTSIPCIVTDSRNLNSGHVRLNFSSPWLGMIFKFLVVSQCELISVIDLRHAYHKLRVTTKPQMYCGITA